MAELDEVLRRPKFDKYLAETLRLEFLGAFLDVAEVIIVSEEIAVCRDARDDKFLSLAVSGNASHVVSGDRDLLALHALRGIAIVTPQVFLTQLAVPPSSGR